MSILDVTKWLRTSFMGRFQEKLSSFHTFLFLGNYKMHKIMCAKMLKKTLNVITFEEYRFMKGKKLSNVSMLGREGRTFPSGGER